MRKGKSLSIIVPAFRAEKFIGKNLVDLKRALERSDNKFEIICVVDGKVDDTYKEAKSITLKYPEIIKVCSYQKNRGKGYAVRYGMGKAKGKLVGFFDAGGEIDPKSLLDLLKIQKKYDSDFVIGSKRHPQSEISYPLSRKIISYGYLFLVKFLFNFGISDTQAGIKLYKESVIKKILPKLKVDGYAFDVEILSACLTLGFRKFKEAPITVRMDKHSHESTISGSGFLTSFLEMFLDTIRVFYRYKIVKIQ